MSQFIQQNNYKRKNRQREGEGTFRLKKTKQTYLAISFYGPSFNPKSDKLHFKKGTCMGKLGVKMA